MTIHITAGECLKDILEKRYSQETFVPFNEAMMTGSYTAGLFSDEFIQERADTHQTSVAEYKEKLQGFLEFLNRMDLYDEVVLWFGDEPFCQANTRAVLQTLKERKFQGKVRLHIVTEETGDIKSTHDCTVSVGLH